MSEYTALVLGAGASMTYGYPSGADLKREILNLSASQAFRSVGHLQPGLLSDRTHDDKSHLEDFQTEFRNSGADSIDTFLGHRDEFMEIGKGCIALLLLQCERKDRLFPAEGDDWYSYFWNRYKTKTWDELDFSDIKIVTFNYDRSFEQYLLQVLKSLHRKTDKDALEKLATLEIVHVYGSLGATLPGQPGYMKYGEYIDRSRIEHCVSTMNLIRDRKGVENSPTLERSREILRGAKSIAFLGFGFDDTNVERIGAENACATQKLVKPGEYANPYLVTYRQLVGTAIGLTTGEQKKYYQLLAGQPPNILEAQTLYNLNCTLLLRETLILD